MKIQDVIEVMEGAREFTGLAYSESLKDSIQFVDNVNTQLINAMMLLEATFIEDGTPVDMAKIWPRVAAIHELVQCAWTGVKPSEKTADVVASIISKAAITDAMKGPPA